MIINRIWAMPNRWTFKIKPISNLLAKYNIGEGWVDPFAGENSPAEITNDLNNERKVQSHLDALEFLKLQKNNFAKGLLYDPPYSFRQASECYKTAGFESAWKVTRMDYWGNCKNEIARIVKFEGLVISFGWNSNGMGKTRGFKIIEILIVPHGGDKNDTLVTVEQKIQSNLFD